MSEWRDNTLGDLIELQRGHDLPADQRSPGTVPIIGSFGVTGYHNASKYSGPGVAIGRSGASIGRATFVPSEYWPLNTCLFVKDFRGNDPRWVFHLLHMTDFNAFNSGSAQPSLNRNFLRGIPVKVPPLPEQRAIAEVLGALDDKIAANTKLGQVADEWVRTNFEQLSRSADETATVGDLVKQRREQVTPTSLAVGTKYVGLEHVPRRHMWLGDGGAAEEVTSLKSRFEEGDILFGKLRPYFHKVVAAPHGGVCSTDILVVTPARAELGGYALAAVSSDLVVRQVTAASEGTRMPRTSWKDLSSVEIPWPRDAAAHRFGAAVDDIREAVQAALAENSTLAATRDALLPQLMSGKLRVKDAEKVAAEVV